jgi:hypothetical protein
MLSELGLLLPGLLLLDEVLLNQLLPPYEMAYWIRRGVRESVLRLRLRLLLLRLLPKTPLQQKVGPLRQCVEIPFRRLGALPPLRRVILGRGWGRLGLGRLTLANRRIGALRRPRFVGFPHLFEVRGICAAPGCAWVELATLGGADQLVRVGHIRSYSPGISVMLCA